MYTLSRLMLILTVVGCCCCLVAVAVVSGGLALSPFPSLSSRSLSGVDRRCSPPTEPHDGRRSETCSTPEWLVPGAGRSSAGWRITPRPRC